MTNSQDAIAAFLAKGGKVTKAAEGAGIGLTNRQWYMASRDATPVTVLHDEDATEIDHAISQRGHEIACALGVEGLNDFRAGVVKHGAKAMLEWKE